MNFWPCGKLIVLAGVTVASLSISALERVDAAVPGVRHILKGSLSFDTGGVPGNSLRKSTKDLPARKGAAADIQIDVRISDHAPNADFYGVVKTKFSNVREGQPAAEQTIWEAAKCHYDRGLPKISVLAIHGEITDGDTSTRVMALPRHIGKLMPDDEIVVSRQVPFGLNRDGAELLMRAATKASGLMVMLRLVTKHCDILGTSSPRSP